MRTKCNVHRARNAERTVSQAMLNAQTDPRVEHHEAKGPESQKQHLKQTPSAWIPSPGILDRNAFGMHEPNRLETSALEPR